MIFPGDFVSPFVSRVPASPALFEDHRVLAGHRRDVCTRVGDLLAVLYSATDSLSVVEVQQAEMRSPPT